jgi:hypothetical protein
MMEGRIKTMKGYGFLDILHDIKIADETAKVKPTFA